MQLHQSAAASAASIAFLMVLLSASTWAAAHNITKILANDPDFSSFNHYLSETHLAADINSRQTITVLAVDNSAMSSLTAKHPTLTALKSILSLHVLLDYFGAKQLHEISNGTVLTTTLFQTTGSAPGTSGYVNITDLKAGKVGFSADSDGNFDSVFVKSIKELPYNISIIQISRPLESKVAEAPSPSPADQNLTAIMSSHGCRAFAEALAASSAASKDFANSLDGGLTALCPLDDAFKKFAPKFNNLTASGKVSLLLFHAIPVYESIAMLKSNNGAMNTLATDGAKRFVVTVQNSGNEVTLKTSSSTAKITGTIIDQQPLAIYSIDNVLLPKELFKARTVAPTPAPAPAPEAQSPKSSKSSKAPSAADSDSPDVAPEADRTADSNGAVRFNGVALVFAAALSLWIAVMVPLLN